MCLKIERIREHLDAHPEMLTAKMARELTELLSGIKSRNMDNPEKIQRLKAAANLLQLPALTDGNRIDDAIRNVSQVRDSIEGAICVRSKGLEVGMKVSRHGGETGVITKITHGFRVVIRLDKDGNRTTYNPCHIDEIKVSS